MEPAAQVSPAEAAGEAVQVAEELVLPGNAPEANIAVATAVTGSPQTSVAR